MPWTKWTVAAVCLPVALLGACSSSSKNGAGSSTSTTIAHSESGTVAASAWKDAAEGKFRTKAWKVSTATSSTGWRCYDPQGAARTTTVNGSTTTTVAGPSRDGRSAVCLPPATAASSSTDKFVAIVNGADANQWVLIGAVADGVNKVSIGFADGTRTPLNIDPHSRLVIWKGPASVKPKDIRADTTTCAIDPAQKTAGVELCAGVTAA